MFGLGMELTNKCNFSCLHCLRDKSLPREDLSIKIFDKIIKQAKAFGQFGAGLTGGEPTLHPQFDYIIETFAREKIKFTIVTNGWNFQDILPIFLKGQGFLPSALVFSLDGAKEATHDKIRKPGSFRKIMQAITICRKRMIPFALQMSVCLLNEREMEEMCFLATKLNASLLSIIYTSPTPELIKLKIAKPPEELESYYKTVNRLSSAFRIPINTNYQWKNFISKDNFLFGCCFFTGNYLNIDYRGNLTFCCNISGYSGSANNRADIIGSLKDENLPALYKKFLKMIYIFKQKMLDDIIHHRASDIDTLACLYCIKYFHKMDWVKNFPNSQWHKYINIRK